MWGTNCLTSDFLTEHSQLPFIAWATLTAFFATQAESLASFKIPQLRPTSVQGLRLQKLQFAKPDR
jgi:hypothetical protein